MNMPVLADQQKLMFISSVRHWVPSREQANKGGWWEDQGNPFCKHALMMTFQESFHYSDQFLTLLVSLRICWQDPLSQPQTKGCIKYDTNLHPVECRVLLLLPWKCQLGSYLWIK